MFTALSARALPATVAAIARRNQKQTGQLPTARKERP